MTGLLTWDVSDVGLTGFEGHCLAPANSDYFDEDGHCARYTGTSEAYVLYVKRAGGLGSWCWTFRGAAESTSEEHFAWSVRLSRWMWEVT